MSTIVTLLAVMLGIGALMTAVSLLEDDLYGWAAFWLVLALLNGAYVITGGAV